jgi:hypothetical protein
LEGRRGRAAEASAEVEHRAPRPQSRADSSLRSALQKVDEVLVSFEQFGPSGPEGFLPAFCPPERPRNGPSLIPAGDPYSSRGERPRKMRPPQGPTPQARGRMPVTSPRSCGPRPKGIRPPQGRGTSVALSGGVARQPTDYYLVPLQGTKNPPFGLAPRHPASDITDSCFRLYTLRMTCHPDPPRGRRIRFFSHPAKKLHVSTTAKTGPDYCIQRRSAVCYRAVENGNSGLFGFRPSRHRVSQGPVIPASSPLA